MCCNLFLLKHRHALCTHQEKLKKPTSKRVCVPSLFVRVARGLCGLWDLPFEQRRANFVAIHVCIIASAERYFIQTRCAAPPHQATAQAQ